MTLSTVDDASGWECPVPVSPIEAVLECFWIPQAHAVKLWRIEVDASIQSSALRATWDSAVCEFTASKAGAALRMTRAYDLHTPPYERLLLRLRQGTGVSVSIDAVVSGRRNVVAQHVSGSHKAQEVGGPIREGRLESVTLHFTAEDAGAYAVELRWIMLTRSGARWTAPACPFAGMLSDHDGGHEPGRGLVLSADDLAVLRRRLGSSSSGNIMQKEEELAARQLQVDPLTMLRQYALYAPDRYGRLWDEDVDLGCDGLQLALVGMLTRNADYMRQAARHAIVLARIEHWAEGFMDRTPQLPWYHAGFAPNVMTIKASLLLDWTWSWLSPGGRSFIRRSIRCKGLRFLEGVKHAMVNQGIRFNKGRILGHMAVSDDWHDPELRDVIHDGVRIINQKLKQAVHADGTFSEGIGYGKGTIASTLLSYVAAARCLDVPVQELVSPLIAPALRYIHDAEQEMSPVFAAFAAGLLGQTEVAAHCGPARLMQSWAADRPDASGQYCETVSFGLSNLWALPPERTPTANPRPFAVYREGGWVFMGQEDPSLPRITFESGLWDGHGHAWMHKNALTMTGWGRTLLLPRGYVNYDDARSAYTQSTKLNNTFSPGERNQDARGTPGCGGRLSVAEDLGAVVVAQSDCATAWQRNVRRNLRRVVFIRPCVVLVEDTMELEREETGVQSWNSLAPWVIENPFCCASVSGDAGVRMRCLTPRGVTHEVAEDSVHADPQSGEVMPAYRATFTSEAAVSHRLLTFIEAIPSAHSEESALANIAERGHDVVEIQRPDLTVRVMPVREDLPSELTWGCRTDGELMVLVRGGDQICCIGAFNATWIAAEHGVIRGDGFVFDNNCRRA